MMPGILAAHLIVSQTAFALGLAKAVLDEEPLGLVARQFGPRRVLGGVGQAIVGDVTGADFPAHEQMPAAGLGLGVVPDPDTGMQVLGDQLPFLTPAQA